MNKNLRYFLWKVDLKVSSFMYKKLMRRTHNFECRVVALKDCLELL